MAFCNSCGTNLQPEAKFCPKCGATVPATYSQAAGGARPSAAPVQPAATPVAAARPNQTVKIVLIVVAILVGLGILGTIAATVIGLHIARRTKVEEHNGNVRVQTPFGTVESNQDAESAMHDMGVEPYPGAETINNGAQHVNIGGMHTVSVQMQTDDPPQKVAQFYQQQLPHANVNVSDNKHYTIVSQEHHNLVTVNIEPQDGKTMIHIASVTGKGAGDGEGQGKAEE